jgi:hypothetical protein
LGLLTQVQQARILRFNDPRNLKHPIRYRHFLAELARSLRLLARSVAVLAAFPLVV